MLEKSRMLFPFKGVILLFGARTPIQYFVVMQI